MTVTEAPVRRRRSVVRYQAGPAPSSTRMFVLRNPWLDRLVVGCAVAAGAATGSLAGVWTFRDASWLDAVAGVALGGAVLVAVCAVLAGRYWRRAPLSAWTPAADPNRP